MVDLVSRIMAFEQGELDHDATLELFSALVTNGQAWTLQGSWGSYRRIAKALIDKGYLDTCGNILNYDESCPD